MSNPMEPFWDKVNEMLIKHDGDTSIENGYFEIVAHGTVWRSMPMDRMMLWVSWEPYTNRMHFSSLTDPNATIRWVEKKSICPRCKGTMRVPDQEEQSINVVKMPCPTCEGEGYVERQKSERRVGVLKSGQRVTVRQERKISGGWVCMIERHPDEEDWPHFLLGWTEPMCNIFDPETGMPLSPSVYRRTT